MAQTNTTKSKWELTAKFGIKASPAMVEQEEKQLKIREIVLND
jgi:hypothetical protein